MHITQETRQRILCLIALVLVVGFVGCKKAAKGVVVINNGETKMVTMKIGSNGEIPNLWEPGWVVLFRTDGKIPGGEAVKAGEAYRIDDQKKLARIGTFDLKKSDQELAKDYQ
jgi:hypothetical protein